MSQLPDHDPACAKEPECNLVALSIAGRPRDLGGFSVRRVLPSAMRRLVGPFIFFDHMGPSEFAPGQGGINVRPHPHVCLATVTYLFEGEIHHRDSLGSSQPIVPGEVNWMTAGKGIVHSERTSPERRASGGKLHGIQAWVALPEEHEETEPSFAHHGKDDIPAIERPGVRLRLIAGKAYGAESPVKVFSPTFYLDAVMDEGASLELPGEHAERAVYVVEGRIRAGACEATPGTMLVFEENVPATILAEGASRVMLLGGAPVGPRHMFWNFVASSKERLETAKDDWREGRFPKVPGDAEEFIPLPEE